MMRRERGVPHPTFATSLLDSHLGAEKSWCAHAAVHFLEKRPLQPTFPVSGGSSRCSAGSEPRLVRALECQILLRLEPTMVSNEFARSSIRRRCGDRRGSVERRL